MDIMIPNRLTTLGHPHRLAVFRLLMRRYPDRVPATELAEALDLKPNTLSTYVNALMHAGLITRERVGTSLRYAIDMEAVGHTIDYLLLDCCRGRPELCATAPEKAPDRTYNVLFLCTGNSARSIFAEAILRKIAGDRFNAYSAGTKPQSRVNPQALDLLKIGDHDLSQLSSQHVGDFHGTDAPEFDFVFTVCDKAANEDCPAWPGQPIAAHWGMPDPAQADGTPADKAHAFQSAYNALYARILAFTQLPIASLDRIALQDAVDTFPGDNS